MVLMGTTAHFSGLAAIFLIIATRSWTISLLCSVMNTPGCCTGTWILSSVFSSSCFLDWKRTNWSLLPRWEHLEEQLLDFRVKVWSSVQPVAGDDFRAFQNTTTRSRTRLPPMLLEAELLTVPLISLVRRPKTRKHRDAAVAPETQIPIRNPSEAVRFLLFGLSRIRGVTLPYRARSRGGERSSSLQRNYRHESSRIS